MRAFLLSLFLVLGLSVLAHASEDYNARIDPSGNVELQVEDGSWMPFDIRTRSKGGVVHIPPGADPWEAQSELQRYERPISFDKSGYRYFTLRVD